MAKIITDSSTLFSIEEGKQLGITVVPLSVTINEKNYREFEEIHTIEFIELINKGYLPSSSQPSIGEMVEAYEQNAGDEILVITMADGLSGTYNMCLAAKNLVENANDITVVNSGSLCGPHRYLVMLAATLAKEGKTVAEILSCLGERLTDHISFLLPFDLDYLARGGRCNNVVGHVGSVLHLVPIMVQTKDKKHLERIHVSRGLKRAAKVVLEKMEELGFNENYRLFVSHTNEVEKANEVVEMFKKTYPSLDYEIYMLSPAFVVQGGPGCISVQMIRK